MARVILAVLALCACGAAGLNILGLFPHPGKSHFDVFEPLLLALAEKGHNMTVISHFPQTTAVDGYTDISLRGDTKILLDFIPVNQLYHSHIIYYYSTILLTEFAIESCKSLRMKQIQDFMKTDQKFDLIITEMFNTDCYLGFVHHFKVPFIGLSSCTIMPWTNSRFGNPSNPSYIPINLLPHSDSMSFLERVENTLFEQYAKFVFKYFMQSPGYEEAKMHFGDDLPPLEDIASNASLFLINTHFSLNRPRPLPPNVIEAGGMFLKPVKKLPEDIQSYLDGAKDGVIYFSMGSMIRGSSLPDHMREAFLASFAKLPGYRVLWKWGDEPLPNKPANVKTKPWLPQQDVLCHPNVKAFISHGGLLGTMEAVNCGVPIIAMPQYGDQFTNAKAIESSGAGIVLRFGDITEKSVADSLSTILDPSFNRRVKELSRAFKDRPLPAMDTAIYWVEYVARHGGGDRLRTHAVRMPFYQYLLLDVIAFIAAVLIAVLFAVYWCVRCTSRALCRKDATKVKRS